MYFNIQSKDCFCCTHDIVLTLQVCCVGKKYKVGLLRSGGHFTQELDHFNLFFSSPYLINIFPNFMKLLTERKEGRTILKRSLSFLVC